MQNSPEFRVQAWLFGGGGDDDDDVAVGRAGWDELLEGIDSTMRSGSCLTFNSQDSVICSIFMAAKGKSK